MQIKVYGKSDVGLVRPGNEDYLHIDGANRVYAVCDGMGGHQAGEVASMTAGQTIRQTFSAFSQSLLTDPELGLGRTLPPSGDLLVKAVRLANRAIYNRALAQPETSGMGTTVVAVALESDLMSVVHVGDSRAYRLTEDSLQPLTRDHSWIQEIADSQNISEEEAGSVVGKNVITRALGVKEGVAVDYRLLRVKPGEQFILCSDGLCGFADDDEIYDVARNYRDNLQKLVEALIQMANDRGGSDNVTVLALEIDAVTESPLPEVEVFTVAPESESVQEAEDRWLAQFEADQLDEPEVAATGGTNKLVLLVIFLVFVMIAVVVVWLLPER